MGTTEGAVADRLFGASSSSVTGLSGPQSENGGTCSQQDDDDEDEIEGEAGGKMTFAWSADDRYLDGEKGILEMSGSMGGENNQSAGEVGEELSMLLLEDVMALP